MCPEFRAPMRLSIRCSAKIIAYESQLFSEEACRTKHPQLVQRGKEGSFSWKSLPRMCPKAFLALVLIYGNEKISYPLFLLG